MPANPSTKSNQFPFGLSTSKIHTSSYRARVRVKGRDREMLRDRERERERVREKYMKGIRYPNTTIVLWLHYSTENHIQAYRMQNDISIHLSYSQWFWDYHKRIFCPYGFMFVSLPLLHWKWILHSTASTQPIHKTQHNESFS